MEWTPFLPSKQHIYVQLPETGQSHFIYESGVGMFLTIRFYTRIASDVKVSYLQPFQERWGFAATTRLHARNFDTCSACSVNFARRFFLRFSRSAQVISGSPHNAHSHIRAKPCSGSAATITLMV